MNVLYGPDISRNTNILSAYNAQAELLKNDLYQAQNWNNSASNRRISSVLKAREHFQTEASATVASATDASATEMMNQGEASVQSVDDKMSVLNQAGVALKINNLEEERKRALYAIMKKYDDVKKLEETIQKQSDIIGLGASVPTPTAVETFTANPTAVQRIGEFIDEKQDMSARMDNDLQTMAERIMAAERDYLGTKQYIFILKAIMAFLAIAILFITLNKINLINDNIAMTSISVVFIAFAIILFMAMTKITRDKKKQSVKFSKDLKEFEETKKNLI